jgi:hypothetical protein
MFFFQLAFFFDVFFSARFFQAPKAMNTLEPLRHTFRHLVEKIEQWPLSTPVDDSRELYYPIKKGDYHNPLWKSL